ncbi:hypothetical protein MHYP_G00091410 [Metynnis hypsauchen]
MSLIAKTVIWISAMFLHLYMYSQRAALTQAPGRTLLPTGRISYLNVTTAISTALRRNTGGILKTLKAPRWWRCWQGSSTQKEWRRRTWAVVGGAVTGAALLKN